MAGLSREDLGRLHDAFVQANRDLRSRREERDRRIQLKAGPDPRDEHDSPWYQMPKKRRESRAYNLYELAAGIYKRGQVAANPQVSYEARARDNNAVATGLGLLVNQKILAADIEEELSLVVDDGLSMMGVAHMALAGDYPVWDYCYGRRLRAGEPVFESIDFKRWVHDTRVDKFNHGQFRGHSFVAPIDWIRNNKSFHAERRQRVEPTDSPDDEIDYDYPEEDYEADERYRFRKVARLWQLYLPDCGRLIVFHRSPKNPLLDEKWTGADNGPYYELIYDPTPSRESGAPPGAVWEELSMSAADIMAKLLRQARRQKTLAFFPGTHTEDAERIKNASDGEWIRYDGDPNKIFEKGTGGPTAESLALLLQLESMSSRMWGNLDALGGLSPQAETLGQDKLLVAGASQRMAKLQERTIKFTKRVLRDYGWYYFTDDSLDEQLVHSIKLADGSGNLQLPMSFNADHVSGDYFDFTFDVDPYSMQPRTPVQRAQLLTTLYTGVVLPSLQLMLSQGLGLDMNAFFKQLGKGYNLPELADLITFTGQPPTTDGLEMRGPANTSREYTRRNIPQTSNDQRNQMVSSILLSKLQRQPAEQATYTR